jgi:hypothetical protein
MKTEQILKEKNWTGLTFAELCEAGRIGSRETVKDWVQSQVNEEHSGLSFDEVDALDFESVIRGIESTVNEICTRYGIA